MTMLKIFFLFLLFAVVSIISSVVWAKMHAETPPLLVLDMRNEIDFPRHFRTTSDVIASDIDTKGLAKLHAASGGQFSKLALRKVLDKLNTKHVTIIDLRQESHGFLNGNAVSWYGKANAANTKKKPEQILKIQQALLDSLSRQENVTVQVILQKSEDLKIAYTKPIEFAVHQIAPESKIAEDFHLGYYRLYIQDFQAPMASEVDRFVQIVKELPTDEWIYLHCRAGVGRTTTFMVMYDMLHNAKNVSFNAILARQNALGGKDLTQLPDPSSYKYNFARERLRFLQHFYQYAHDNDDDFKTTWSTWLKILKA